VSADPDEPLELYQDPLTPFGPGETVLALARWAAGITYLAGWLGVFIALDKTLVDGRRFDAIGKLTCRSLTRLLGIEVRRHGLDHLAPDASYVFCINHVSLLDLFVVFQSIPYFHRSFQDAAHFRIPVYGGCVRVFGQIPVERGNKESNRRAFAQAAAMIRAGDSFVVFPEGHRTRDGRLGRFHRGAFRLAVETQVPVVPMALRGLRNVCPAGGWRVRGGTVDVLFGAPIPTAGLGEADVADLADRARADLNELMRRGPARTG